MTTEIYGASDDLIEFEGDVYGEVDQWDTGKSPVLVVCSDGTLLEVSFGKAGRGIWRITPLVKGRWFDRIDECLDETAKPHSDVAHFRDGLTSAWVATKWRRVE